jgi:hypothetical protein
MAQQFRNRIRIFGREVYQRIIPVILNAPEDGIARLRSSTIGSDVAAAAQ